MLQPGMVGVIIYASILVILCVGFSLIHMIEKFPNFAHSAYSTIGVLVVFSFTRLWGFSPYLGWPIALLLGGVLGVILYILIIRPMQRQGRDKTVMAFAMFALSFILLTILSTYSYWFMVNFGFTTNWFLLRRFDYAWMGYPGVFYAAPLTCFAVVVSIHLFLTRSKFGIALRATAEDPGLAITVGINTFRVHIIVWFLAGAISALAGAIMPLWMPTNVAYADELLMSVIAGSVLGGLDNIYGSMLGGFLVAFSQRILPSVLKDFLGMWVLQYDTMVPMIVIIGGLLLSPEGITSLMEGEKSPLKRIRAAIRRIG
jgi:branched-chain amino acid transport system permease protein